MEIRDLFGVLCRQYFDFGIESELKLQLDDGQIMDDFPVSFYVNSTELRELEKKFLEKAKGLILDIGCGPGRVGLVLEQRGLKVVGVDISEHMVYIVTRRGLTARQLDVNKQLPLTTELFNTVIMYGNGFGMPGSLKNIRGLLSRLNSITSEDALIIAESNDPDLMRNNVDRLYQEGNLIRGKYVGMRRWRHVSGDKVGTYDTWVQVKLETLVRIAETTGWKVQESPEYEPDSQWGAYFFTLSKK